MLLKIKFQIKIILLYGKKTGSAKFTFGFIYNNEKYGVWTDHNEGKIFVSSDYDKNTSIMLALTLKDHSPNTLMFNAMKKYNFWRNFLKNFSLGNVYFENQRIKHNAMEVIKISHSI